MMTHYMMIHDTHLDRETDDDEQEVRSGEARQEGVGRGLEGGLPHHRQNDQDVAAHPQTEGEARMMINHVIFAFGGKVRC